MSSYYLVPTPRGCRAVTADERVRELEDENARLRRLLEDGPANPQECAEFCRTARDDGDGKPCLDCDPERFCIA